MENFFDDDLLMNFKVETTENLEELEGVLMHAEERGLGKEEVGLLFRLFHSIKGASGMLGLTAIKEVAHASEDILGLVRDGKLQMEEGLINLMLEALDSLKDLTAQTDGQAVQPLPQDLIQRLKAAYQIALGQAPAPKGSRTPAALAQVTLSPEIRLTLEGEQEKLEPLLHAQGRLSAPKQKAAQEALELLIQIGSLMDAAPLANKAQEILNALTQAKPDRNLLSHLTAELLQMASAPTASAPSDPAPPATSAAVVPPTAAQVQPSPAAPQTTTAEASSKTEADRSVNLLRVSGETLDQFMDQIGELVLIRSILNHLVHDEEVKTSLTFMKANLEELNQRGEQTELVQKLSEALEAIQARQQRIVQTEAQMHGVLRRLQEQVMELRVVPVQNLFNRFPRLVRDLAKTQGKKVRLEIDSQGVRIDKGMIELLVDPLTHMIRNSVDHGIEDPKGREAAKKDEQGKVLLTASQKSNRILITVQDDGQGLHPEKILDKAVKKQLITAEEARHASEEEIFRLIFLPGFSTAEQITDISGRGVGMDVVKSNITKLGGNVKISSTPGQGSVFTFELPLSAAIQETLPVKVANQMFAFPDRFVAEVVESELASVQTVKGTHCILLREQFLPVMNLASVILKRVEPCPPEATFSVVVLVSGKQRLGLVVDQVFRRQELVIKDLHPMIAALPGVGGASILGDGRIVLILDGDEIFQLAEKLEEDPFFEQPPQPSGQEVA